MAITVKRVSAYEVSDSNGNPTLEAEMVLSNGFRITSSVSSDNVINTYGMRELRDHDMSHYQGLGVKSAVNLVNNVIAPRLVNMIPNKQFDVDAWLIKSDGTADKSKLGINTVVLISQLFAKAGAYITGMPLYKYINMLYKWRTNTDITLERIPLMCVQLLAGMNNTEFEEINVIPSSSLPFGQAYEMMTDVYHSLQLVLDQNDIPFSKNSYGAFSPIRDSNSEYLDLLFDAIQRKSLKTGKHIFTALNPNGTNFYLHGRYTIKEKHTTLSPDEYYQYLLELISKYSVLLIEDAFAVNDPDGWKKMYVNMNDQIYIMGHKYVGGHIDFLNTMDTGEVLTSFVIKPQYFGTITETLEAVYKARKKEITFMVEADRNDTDDDFIADFAMAVQADFVKFGSPSQGERVSKYNRFLKIEQMAKMAKLTAPTVSTQPTQQPVQTPPSQVTTKK